jgi:hypothetical protein
VRRPSSFKITVLASVSSAGGKSGAHATAEPIVEESVALATSLHEMWLLGGRVDNAKM